MVPGELLKVRIGGGGGDMLWLLMLTQQKEPPRGQDGGRHEVEDRLVSETQTCQPFPHASF